MLAVLSAGWMPVVAITCLCEGRKAGPRVGAREILLEQGQDGAGSTIGGQFGLILAMLVASTQFTRCDHPRTPYQSGCLGH